MTVKAERPGGSAARPHRPIGTRARHLRNPGFKHVLLCGTPMGPFVATRCWLAAENRIFAAYSMELGTCVSGAAVPALDTSNSKADLEISDEFSAVAPIINEYFRTKTQGIPR